MTRKVTILILLTTLFAYCSKPPQNNIHTPNFSIYVPPEMDTTSEISKSAVLQMWDAKKELYLNIDKIPAQKYPNNKKLFQEYVKPLFIIQEMDTVSSFKDSTYNLYAKIDEITDDEYIWIIRIAKKINGNYYYVIWTWTPYYQFGTNEKTMRVIVNSFKTKN